MRLQRLEGVGLGLGSDLDAIVIIAWLALGRPSLHAYVLTIQSIRKRVSTVKYSKHTKHNQFISTPSK